MSWAMMSKALMSVGVDVSSNCEVISCSVLARDVRGY